MRILFSGGRHDRRERLGIWAFKVLLRDGRLGSVEELIGIQGCASGWDTFARVWLVSLGKTPQDGTLLDFPIRTADWDRYGKGAGPRRNTQMLVEGKPDLLVAGPGGTGTANMIEQTQEANLPFIDLTKEDWFLDGVQRYHETYGR